MAEFVERHGLRRVIAQDTGFTMRIVWVLDPLRRHMRIYRAEGTVSIVEAEEDLDGEDVFPGFRCPLGDIL